MNIEVALPSNSVNISESINLGDEVALAKLSQAKKMQGIAQPPSLPLAKKSKVTWSNKVEVRTFPVDPKFESFKALYAHKSKKRHFENGSLCVIKLPCSYGEIPVPMFLISLELQVFLFLGFE